MEKPKVYPERPVVLALIVLILIGAAAIVIYSLLGGKIGQPAGFETLNSWMALVQPAVQMI